MLSRVYSFGVQGVEGYPVLVELDVSGGLPGFTTVGLPDDSVREARERVASAVRNSGYKFPQRRVTVNLAPAQTRKEGSHFDLAIALALLAASGEISPERLRERYGFVGELALDGTLRPARGVLAMAMRAREEGFKALIVARENVAEARAAGLKAFTAKNLREVAEFFCGDRELLEEPLPEAVSEDRSCLEDLSDVKGQRLAKRVLEIAAAGSHNVLLVGPPGIGKSMISRRLSTILPPMSEREVLEVSRLHSVATRRPVGLVKRRPFRAPHHTASAASLVGGGPAGRPGEISLAHGGVLFLDEISFFSRSSLEALRQPLEDFRVTVSRARETYEYPARFILVAATNPCPCGWRGHPRRECVCTPMALRKYLERLSGPLLERIDLQLEMAVPSISPWAEMGTSEEASEVVRARVIEARVRQERRSGRLNAHLPSRALREHCRLDGKGVSLLESASTRLALSARSSERILKVARTIADLSGADAIGLEHLTEALQYRSLERLKTQASVLGGV